MRALRTAINQFFVTYDVAWETFMAILVIVWLLLGAEPRSAALNFVADAITVFFAIEFAVRFLAAFEHRAYFRAHWIDVVTLLPMLRGFRLLRLLRLLRLIRATRGLASAVEVLGYLAEDLTIKMLFTVWFSILVIASFMFYIAEAGKNPEVSNVFDAAWWALVTATTVGYGDVTPVTVAGRMAGIVMMLAGIATFSALAGLIGSALQRRRAELAQAGTPEEGDDPSVLDTADPAVRLRRLETLRGEGLITTEEYDAKRATVMAEL
jgi:voltage-gated potassium channel Kch